MAFAIPPAGARRWDLVALGEVMLRFDPGDERITTTRAFRVWEGGGEYNVARGLARTFGLRSTLVTAFADNPIGRLIEDLIRQGGVDQSHVRWTEYDGVGRTVRNPLNFVERGFGVRAPLGCSDRGNSAAGQLKPGDIDWDTIFGDEGSRWFHCGGIFAGISETAPLVALEAMEAARRHGVTVSYDLNYRPSLWLALGGVARAQEVNRQLVGMVDVLLGNEEDFTAALGFDVEGLDSELSVQDPDAYARMIEDLVREFPNLGLVATTLRQARSATRNDWGAICWADGNVNIATPRSDLEVFDRVGGGDSFASGLIFALLSGYGPDIAVEYGAAHGALAMTTPGDTSMVSREEVERVMRGGSTRVTR